MEIIAIVVDINIEERHRSWYKFIHRYHFEYVTKTVVTWGRHIHLSSPKRPCIHSCAGQGWRSSPARKYHLNNLMFPRMDKNRFGLTTFNAMYDFTENPPTMVSASFWMWHMPEKSWIDSMQCVKGTSWPCLLANTPEKYSKVIYSENITTTEIS